ncbi:MAG: hypothetical protein R3316_01330 [Rhodovibrionaceae bacterium]|nr:hypothetical protein [Rhodovibrionaceae bacterium]
MAEATADRDLEVMTTADGTPLKVSLRRAMRRNKIKAVLLVAPLFLFIFFSFLMPILDMMWRSVENPEVPSTLTRTAEIIEQWDGKGLPSEEIFTAMVGDLKEAGEARTIGSAAKRLNYEESGMRGLLMKS